ncbi:MAG: hypothetical protein ACLFVG_03900 [Candidatus Aminicenantes bacterium]
MRNLIIGALARKAEVKVETKISSLLQKKEAIAKLKAECEGRMLHTRGFRDLI